MSFRLEPIDPESLGGRGRGYSNGILTPSGARLLFVAGQIGVGRGTTPGRRRLRAAVRAGARQRREVVRAAGGAAEHLARLTIYVIDTERVRRRAPRPSAPRGARIVGATSRRWRWSRCTALLEPGARVEIEATAALPPA